MKIISNDKKKFDIRLGFDCPSLVIDVGDKEIELRFDSNQEISDMIEKLHELNSKYALVTTNEYVTDDDNLYFINGDDHILNVLCERFGHKEKSKDNNTGNKS